MKYKLGICSLFRDSQNWNGFEIKQVDSYFINWLACIEKVGLNKDEVCFYVVEGNSNDDTLSVLKSYAKKFNVCVNKLDISGSSVSSIEDDTRFKNLSKLGNLVLNQGKQESEDVLFVESDLVPEVDLIYRIHDLDARTFCISPVPICGTQFYDTWAFKDIDGNKFTNSDLNKFRKSKYRYMNMLSIGSCAYMNGDILRDYNVDFGKGCFPALCAKVIALDEYDILCDTKVEINHPCNKLVAGRYI